jgi:hypothetical protein
VSFLSFSPPARFNRNNKQHEPIYIGFLQTWISWSCDFLNPEVTILYEKLWISLKQIRRRLRLRLKKIGKEITTSRWFHWARLFGVRFGVSVSCLLGREQDYSEPGYNLLLLFKIIQKDSAVPLLLLLKIIQRDSAERMLEMYADLPHAWDVSIGGELPCACWRVSRIWL